LGVEQSYKEDITARNLSLSIDNLKYSVLEVIFNMGKPTILAWYHHFSMPCFLDDYETKSMPWKKHWPWVE
jgi:hypothetical protein